MATTFKLTARRLTALDRTIDAMGAADAAALSFDEGVAEMYAAGFRGVHVKSAGQGGKGEPGVAYAAVSDRGAARLFNKEEMAIWTAGKACPELSELKRRTANYAYRIKTKLEKMEAEKASGGKAAGDKSKGAGKRGGKGRDAIGIDLDTVAKRRSVIENAIKADTPARKATLAEYGGEAKAKAYLAAWDTLRASYPAK